MSISPSGQRQLRATISIPSDSRYSAASSSPRRPRRSLAFMSTSATRLRPAHLGGTDGYFAMWETRVWRKGAVTSVAEVDVLGQREIFVARQFLDVDVLERDDPDALHEPRRTVDIPDPGVLEREVEVDLAVGA